MALSVATTTALANAIGQAHGLSCRYEYRDGRFRWNFYRHGKFVGSTVDPENVAGAVERHIEKMEAQSC